MKKRPYSKPEIEEIRLERLMDHGETLPSASHGVDHAADAKWYDVWGPDETESLPGDGSLWNGWK